MTKIPLAKVLAVPLTLIALLGALLAGAFPAQAAPAAQAPPAAPSEVSNPAQPAQPAEPAQSAEPAQPAQTGDEPVPVPEGTQAQDQGLEAGAKGSDTGLSATDTPFWQTNNTVRAMVYANGLLFVGGEFTKIRPPGAAAGYQEIPRNYLAIFDANTGQPLDFAPQPNGKIWALAASEDGKRVYIGGDFTNIGGLSRGRIAVLDTTTMSWDPAFRPYVEYRVDAIQEKNGTVYIGGSFGAIGGQPRAKLAALNAADGALLPWNPSANADVNVVRASPDGSKIYIGGRFTYMNGQYRLGLATVDATQGTLLPFTGWNYGCNSVVRDIIDDGTNMYLANAGDGYGCFEGVWKVDPSNDTILWTNKCRGATEAITLVKGWLYKGSHAHDCSMEGGFPEGNYRYLLAQNPETGALGGWYPNTDRGGTTKVGPLAFATDGERLWVGGDFYNVNGVGQQGIGAFYSTPLTSPGLPGTPQLRSVTSTSAVMNFKAALDTDNETLSYTAYRKDIATNVETPVYTGDVRSRFWDIPTVEFTDTGLEATKEYSYRVVASDGTSESNSYWSQIVRIPEPDNPYMSAVKADKPAHYFTLNEKNGNNTIDAVGSANGTVTGGNQDAPGILATSGLSLDGTGAASIPQQYNNPTTFTVEAWINTTSTQGGRILGFGSAATGNSNARDRVLYMNNDGKVTFGTYGGQTYTIQSPTPLNDGKWHQVAATMKPGGWFSPTVIRLYVDGKEVASRSGASAQNYSGYWRIGADGMQGWPNQPASNGLAGNYDEVAIYTSALSASQIKNHYDLGSVAVNLPPKAEFTSSCDALACAFDASTSSDPEGKLTGYAWDFGDGTTATTAITDHTYTQPGEYTVTLTVTDDTGQTHQATQQLIVEAAPVEPPDAKFTVDCQQLQCAFSAVTNAEADGVSYAWDFGDGQTGTGANTTHSYTEGGTFSVTLTATDANGVVGTRSESATPVAPPAPDRPLVQDEFARTVTGGWGSPTLGGAYSYVGSRASSSVADGAGILAVPASSSRRINTPVVDTPNVDLTVNYQFPDAPSPGTAYLSTVIRDVDGVGEYRAKITYRNPTNVWVQLVRTNSAGAETALTSETKLTNAVAADGSFALRVRATTQGGTTALVASLAPADVSAGNWVVQANDTTQGMQAAGRLGILLYVNSTSAKNPLTLKVDNLNALAAD